jgi:hypothetical protein
VAPDGPPPPLDPAAPDGGQQLATDPYILHPGDEHYICYQFYAPTTDVAITHATAISAPGIHHMALFTATERTEVDAPHDCPLLKETWNPVWAVGTGSPELALPAGTGMQIGANTQYVLQVHMLNATDGDLTIRGGIDLAYDHSPAALTPAGIYAIGSLDFTIPSGAVDYQLPIDCQPGSTMNVFAVFPHMHKLATEIDVTHSTDGSDPTTPIYSLNPWVFGSQPMDPEQWTVGPNDKFRVTCHYNNPGTDPVGYGESTDDEMCFFIMFYYPFHGLDGCV